MGRLMNKKGRQGKLRVGGGAVMKELPRKGSNGKYSHLNTCTLPRETINTVSRNY